MSLDLRRFSNNGIDLKKSDMKGMQDIWITKTQKTSIVTQKEENRRNEIIFDI